MAYGRKVDETETEVRYAFGHDERDPDAGVLVVPTADPELAYIEDGRPRSQVLAARAVLGKAYRAYDEHGTWPDTAHVFAG